jgi:hypothetical protein
MVNSFARLIRPALESLREFKPALLVLKPCAPMWDQNLLAGFDQGGERVATLELRRTCEKWRIHQLAGKANRLCSRAV